MKASRKFRFPGKKVHLIAICFSLLIFLFAIQHAQNYFKKASADTPVKIMVVGDSISHGSAGNWTWRYRLSQHLASAGASVDFVGPFNGVYDPNTQNWGSQLYLDPNFDREHDATAGRKAVDEKNTVAGYVTTYTPDILLINMGTNDLGLGGMTGLQAANAMAQLITNARNAKPNIKIVLSKITPAAIADPTYNPRWADYNNELASLATSMSSSTSAIVLADPTLGYDPAVDTYDGVHPTPSGEYKIAAAFADALWNGFGIGGLYGPIPAAPIWPVQPIVTATPGNGQATLTWSAVAGADGYYIYQRNVTKGEAMFRLPYAITSTTFTGGYLINGDTYEFAVSTKRGNIGDSVDEPMSTPVKVILPKNFYSVADTYVSSYYKTSVYGAQTSAYVDGSPNNYTYLKFDLRPLAGKTITSMTLKIKSYGDSTTNTQRIRISSNYLSQNNTNTPTTTAWTESATKWINKPAVPSKDIATFNPGNKTYTWFSINVTDGLKSLAGQYVTLAIVQASYDTNNIRYYTRESSYDPYLVVTYQ